MNLSERVKLLKAKLKQKTNPLVAGFDKAWAKEGYGPAIAYLAGLNDEEIKELLGYCTDARAALVLGCCDDEIKIRLCDVMGIEKSQEWKIAADAEGEGHDETLARNKKLAARLSIMLEAAKEVLTHYGYNDPTIADTPPDCLVRLNQALTPQEPEKEHP